MNKIFHILMSTFSVYILIIFIGAWLTLKCELTNPDANIKNFSDGFWWSLNATSIGDSNVYPITRNGRVVGIFLIFIGYSIFTINVGVISAFLSHYLHKKMNK